MTRTCTLVFPQALYLRLTQHLFPGDHDEHGGVIVAGLAKTESGYKLLAREFFPADEPNSYGSSRFGYKALQATFIHRCIVHCRDRRLVYIAVHNHGGEGSVAFSQVDLSSHERGYPSLLDIASGMPVGALVVAVGAMEVDIWFPEGRRSALLRAEVIGERVDRIYPSRVSQSTNAREEHYDRQVRFLGTPGQQLLKDATVGIVGLGGIGSLVNEYLARLGVGQLLLCDPDRLEPSNFSRVVGATPADLQANKRRSPKAGTLKVDIARRIALDANPEISIVAIPDDFARDHVARRFLDCDFIFLAADSMRSRLIFNAIVHQYFIPGVQLGTKITVGERSGELEGAFSVVRRVTPGVGCLLCNQLIDSYKLAQEWKTDDERKRQQYGTSTPNPSVITMNAVAAAHAVNDFLFYFVGLSRTAEHPSYRRFDHLSGSAVYDEPRIDQDCTECSTAAHSRFGMGDAMKLPSSE